MLAGGETGAMGPGGGGGAIEEEAPFDGGRSRGACPPVGSPGEGGAAGGVDGADADRNSAEAGFCSPPLDEEDWLCPFRFGFALAEPPPPESPPPMLPPPPATIEAMPAAVLTKLEIESDGMPARNPIVNCGTLRTRKRRMIEIVVIDMA